MPPAVRRFALTAHVVSSVGWLGAVVAFLGLAVAGLTSQDGQLVRAVYLAAEPLMWFVIVPLAVASLITGVVQSLGTTWGLFRHYWVLFKLLINVFATIVLLMYTQTLSSLAGVAADPSADLGVVRSGSPLFHAAAAVLLLLVAAVLAVYKPRGLAGLPVHPVLRDHEPPAGGVPAVDRSVPSAERVEVDLAKQGHRFPVEAVVTGHQAQQRA